jgi:hypothetical protein
LRNNHSAKRYKATQGRSLAAINPAARSSPPGKVAQLRKQRSKAGGQHAGYMFRFKTAPVATALLALTLSAVAGCSSSGSSASTTAAGSTATGPVPSGLPATKSVDGFTLSVTSSPTRGTTGHTTVIVRAVLTGTVKPATLALCVLVWASADAGWPASEQRVTVKGPGTYPMPHPFSPDSPGSWAPSVTFVPNQSGASRFSVSGLPPVAGSPSPFPQLVTVAAAA